MNISSHKLLAPLKVIIAALILAVGIQYLFADVWGIAPANPPSCPSTTAGCNAPINTGTSWQYKNGSLTIAPGASIPTQITPTPALDVIGGGIFDNLGITGNLVVGSGNPIIPGEVLTAQDASGTVGWAAGSGGSGGVTGIVAGSNITVTGTGGVTDVLNHDKNVATSPGLIYLAWNSVPGATSYTITTSPNEQGIIGNGGNGTSYSGGIVTTQGTGVNMGGFLTNGPYTFTVTANTGVLVGSATDVVTGSLATAGTVTINDNHIDNFGGTYMVGWNYTTGTQTNTCVHGNPLDSGICGCPTGYTAYITWEWDVPTPTIGDGYYSNMNGQTAVLECTPS